MRAPAPGLRRLLALAAVVAGVGLADGAAAATDPSFVAPEPPHRIPSLMGTAHEASAGPVPSYTPRGKILADSGFRPWVDGFAFENYGNAAEPQNLTPVEVEDIFGPRVCLAGTGAACLLLPPMEEWMESENAKMASGHCVGFSITALRMFQRSLSPAAFGGPGPQDLQIVDNRALQSRIAESWAYQQLPAVYGALVEGPPSRLLARLEAALRRPAGESYTIGLTGAGAGHAVTPFAVERTGATTANVLVYDNNYPGVTRAIQFDTKADTWLYHGDPNPADRAGRYTGSARHRTMFLLPTSPATRRQPCPFCGSADDGRRRAVGAPERTRYDEISLAGDPVDHGHLVLFDRQGRRTGFVRGRILNQIPGVHVVRHLTIQNWRAAPEPSYRVRDGERIQAIVDGSDLDAPTVENLTLMGPHYFFEVERLHLNPGQRDRFEFRAGEGEMEYRTDVRHRRLSPVLHVAVTEGQGDRRAAYVFRVVTRGLRGRLDLLLRNDRDRGVFAIDTRTTTLSHGNAREASLVITLERRSAAGLVRWRGVVPMGKRQVAKVRYHRALDPAGTLPIAVSDAEGHRATVTASPVA